VPIADYLLDAGLDVYFDEYDKTLDELVNQGNADAVTRRIQEGIDRSSHMLAVVSPKTITSYWVPFEIGYGYERTGLGVLTLKGLVENLLPEYLRTTRIIRGTKSLNAFVSELLGTTQNLLESRQVIKAASTAAYPLDGVLDWNS
jgi:hypothetical protein